VGDAVKCVVCRQRQADLVNAQVLPSSPALEYNEQPARPVSQVSARKSTRLGYYGSASMIPAPTTTPSS
jgi:hypothetical protein